MYTCTLAMRELAPADLAAVALHAPSGLERAENAKIFLKNVKSAEIVLSLLDFVLQCSHFICIDLFWCASD